LLILIFDIAKDAGMLPIVLHQNNLQPMYPMYEKWLHGEQAMWLTHAEWFNILEQPAELRRYIRARYQVIATLASRVMVSTANRGGSH
jgi:hypothetical protein